MSLMKLDLFILCTATCFSVEKGGELFAQGNVFLIENIIIKLAE